MYAIYICLTQNQTWLCMIKKSLSLVFLFSLFAIILPSVTFSMEDKKEYQPPDMKYAKPYPTDFQAEIFRNGRTISIGLATVILKLTKPVVKKVDNEVLTFVHDVLDNTATVNTAVLILCNTNNKIKVGWQCTAILAMIVAASKTDQAKKIEQMIYLDRLNKMYPWLPNVLSGSIAACISIGASMI